MPGQIKKIMRVILAKNKTTAEKKFRERHGKDWVLDYTTEDKSKKAIRIRRLAGVRRFVIRGHRRKY